MIGTIVNTGTILAGTLIGSAAKKGIKPKYQQALFTAMGLSAAGIGINSIVQNMPESKYPVLFIVSLAVGSFLGTALNLEERFKTVAEKVGLGEFAKGLSTAILLFCIVHCRFSDRLKVRFTGIIHICLQMRHWIL